MSEINCGGCGRPLSHINEVCDDCLPNFYSPTPHSELEPPVSGQEFARGIGILVANSWEGDHTGETKVQTKDLQDLYELMLRSAWPSFPQPAPKPINPNT